MVVKENKITVCPRLVKKPIIHAVSLKLKASVMKQVFFFLPTCIIIVL